MRDNLIDSANVKFLKTLYLNKHKWHNCTTDFNNNCINIKINCKDFLNIL